MVGVVCMRVTTEVRDQLAVRFAGLLPHLNERQQQRLALAVEVRLLGHGSVRGRAGRRRQRDDRPHGHLRAGGRRGAHPPGRVRRPGGAASPPGRTPTSCRPCWRSSRPSQRPPPAAVCRWRPPWTPWNDWSPRPPRTSSTTANSAAAEPDGQPEPPLLIMRGRRRHYSFHRGSTRSGSMPGPRRLAREMMTRSRTARVMARRRSMSTFSPSTLEARLPGAVAMPGLR